MLRPCAIGAAVPGQSRAHQADCGLRRALLPHVGVLSGWLRSRLPLHESNGLPDPDRAETGCRAADARLSGRRGKRRGRDALNGGRIAASLLAQIFIVVNRMLRDFLLIAARLLFPFYYEH